MFKVTVFLWNEGNSINQKYSRRLTYRQFPNFLGTINRVREELFPDGGVLQCTKSIEIPNREINVVYIDAESGIEYKQREYKNVYRIKTRRESLDKRYKEKKPGAPTALAEAFKAAEKTVVAK